MEKQRYIKRKILGIKGFFVTAILCGFCSCVKETVLVRRTDVGEATVTFALVVPTVSRPVSRSLSDADEGNVSTVDVMVFASGQYRFTQAAYNVVDITASKKTFEVKLPLGTYDLSIIANGRSSIQAENFQPGDAKAVVLNALECSLTAGMKWKSDQIPMWGNCEGVMVDENISLTGANAIWLTRMLSKVEVILENAAAGPDNSNFSITSVRLYNYNTAGKLVPDLVNGWNTTTGKATAPHLAAVSGKISVPLVYTSTDDPTGNYFTPSWVLNTIYMFEAGAGSTADQQNNTCVVVGGSYQGSAPETHFYRMDFVRIEEKATVWLPLLRNHSYLFRVYSISGAGFPTPQEAFDSGPVNIEADVLEWDSRGVVGIFISGTKYILLHRGRNGRDHDDRTAILYRDAGSTDTVGFETNIPLDQFALSLTGGDISDPLEPMVVSNDRFRVRLQGEGGEGLFEFTALQPYGTMQNPSTLTVMANRIQFDITLLQKNEGSSDWGDGGNIDKDF